MRAYLVLVTAMLFSACDRSVADPTDQLSLSLQVSPVEMRAGEAMDIRLIATNGGMRSRSISTNVCPDLFTVTTDDGKLLQNAPRICSMSAMSKTLEAGEQIELGLRWPGDVASGLLPPGEYRLQGWVLVKDDGIVESAPQTIRILP